MGNNAQSSMSDDGMVARELYVVSSSHLCCCCCSSILTLLLRFCNSYDDLCYVLVSGLIKWSCQDPALHQIKPWSRWHRRRPHAPPCSIQRIRNFRADVYLSLLFAKPLNFCVLRISLSVGKCLSLRRVISKYVCNYKNGW